VRTKIKDLIEAKVIRPRNSPFASPALRTTVRYLGYEVQAGEIRPNLNNIETLVALPPPRSVATLRQFIWLPSFFRQFVSKFSQMMKPIYFQKSEKIILNGKQNTKMFAWELSLYLQINWCWPFLIPSIELHTDARFIGYGAILLHSIVNKPHVIEYYSKTTSSCEYRYTSYELETLAVVNVVKHFCYYLHGRKFIIFTNCYFFKSSRTKIELTLRVYRWGEYLPTFDFEIQYREGTRMAHVDFLSRNPICHRKNLVENKIQEKRTDLTEISENWLQNRDPEITEIITKLESNDLSLAVVATYELRSNILYIV